MAEIAASEELRKAVGADYADLFQFRVQHTQFAEIEDAKSSELHYELVRHAISLQNAVDDLEEECVLSESSDGEDSWGAGIAVAKAIAASLAAFAAFLGNKDAVDDPLMHFVDQLSIDLDSFSTNLFGGLCRLDTDGICSGELQSALQSICLWAVTIVVHAVGHRQTSLILWEWVGKDPLWACVLVKGFLSAFLDFDVEEQPVAMTEIKENVLEAFAGLASPRIAFATQATSECISASNEELIRHHGCLAIALNSSGMVQVLLKAENSLCRFASFLATLLQPELLADDSRNWSSQRAATLVLLGGDSPTALRTTRQAKAAAVSLRAEIETHKVELWRKLIREFSALRFEVQASVLRNCVQLSYFLPLDMECLQELVSEALYFTSPNGSANDAALLVTLCFVAANSGAYPEDFPNLVFVVSGTSSEVKTLMDSRWERWLWQGCCQMDILAQWIVDLELSKMFQEGASQSVEHLEPSETEMDLHRLHKGDQKVDPSSPLKMRLQDLVLDAPNQFQCAISAQLMMDPVQTPEGFVMERSVLADALNASGTC